MLQVVLISVFLSAGAYVIARAIRRESEVARLQSDFVSAVSHEFRSPLTTIRQLSEILAFGRAPQDARRQQYYDALVGESARLQRLVETLLNFGRMEAGADRFHTEHVDAASVVRRVVAEFEPQLAAAGRRIEFAEPCDSCRIHADPDSVCVALRNLIDNALKYSPNEPEVWVSCESTRGHVAIHVRDRGIGIEPAEREAIFRKFVRGTGAVAANVRGTGVGLAMVRHIATAHRGAVRVASVPGQGSTFTLLFPAVAQG